MTSETPHLSLRIDLPNGTRFGPGKARLLQAVIDTGSISGAALELNMSYPRALKLIDQMNDAFARPLVETKQGGATGGGANVTETGLLVLARYKDICEASTTANRENLADMARFLAG